MSDQGHPEEEASRRTYTAPYSSHHPVPTVQKYREHKGELETRQKEQEETYDEEEPGKLKQAASSIKHIFRGEDDKHLKGSPYPTENRNLEASQNGDQDSSKPPPTAQKDDDQTSIYQHPPGQNSSKSGADKTNGANQQQDGQQQQSSPSPAKDSKNNDKSQKQSATEASVGQSDPRQKRKNMKHMSRNDGGREVTDPVTHLPVTIYDETDKSLKKAPENEPAPGSEPRTTTGLSGASKSKSQLDLETQQNHDEHAGMQKVFPPPNFDDTQAELIRTYQFALTVGLGSIVTLATLVLVAWQLIISSKNASGEHGQDGSGSYARTFIPVLVTVLLSGGVGTSIIFGIRGWLGKKVEEIWQDEIWDAAKDQEDEKISNATMPESTQWLNSLLSSVWPLINPDLFASLADMLEDVMQASLPKLVHMVSVNDLGQGNESFRILGIKWLPTGAASQSVDVDGNLKPAQSQETSDRVDPGEGEEEDDEKDDKDDKDAPAKKESAKKEQEEKSKQQEKEAVAEGLEAEQGDFVNVEIALAYRARSSGRSLKAKAKNAHLYIKFYMPGGVAVPVWVELRGLIMTMRMRLQLTPDPPFFALATITFLGQPKASMSCVPLSKHSLNLMDVPLISSFVQSSIDAALAEYVAPKSLTLDLKDMLMGDDFKKDTVARGVLVIYIKSARDFKEGDSSIGPFKDGSSDGYVTASWAKFAKPIAATRIILSDMEPTWNEWSYLLVTPEELNAEEALRLQLWDSDRTNADDDLGRVEVDLKELMHSPKTKGKMCDREDRLMGEDPNEEMPGHLKWSVGFFAKSRITEEQLAQQSEDPDIHSTEDLKKQVRQQAARKLREATEKDESDELKQQELQGYEEREKALIISTPPPNDHPSGILSIQIHNITGLELEKLRKSRSKDDTAADGEDEAEEADDLPSAYCTIILNHQKIYRTRTKPKNAKPFYNAGTEKFIRDWRTTEVMISCRDARVHENDPLLGIIYLPLAKLFSKRAQVVDSYPLEGGIGFGRARISMVFRSVQLQAPQNLLGWDYGTLEIHSPIKPKSQLPPEISKLRLRLRTSIGKVRMTFDSSADAWTPKRDRQSLFLAVRKRYSSPLIIEFRKSTMGPDSSPAFGVFWLSQIPDEKEQTVTVQVWKGGKKNLKHAESCCDYAGLEDGEQPLGEIELKMKLWRGISGYHEPFSRKGKEQDLRDVMEVLDTANENKEGTEDLVDDDSDADSHSDSDSHGGEKDHHQSGLVGKAMSLMPGHNDADEGKRNPLDDFQDYKDHSKQLHRRHRGLMQFKAPRTADWMVTKARHAKGRVSDMMGHGERATGIETEV